MDCYGCVHYYYEEDCNYRECTHPCWNEYEPDNCPGKVSIEDVRAANRKEKE